MTVINPILYALIADKDLHEAVEPELSQHYSSRFFTTLDDCLIAMEQQQATLFLCQKSCLDDDSTAVLARIKDVNPDIRILVIGTSCAMAVQISLLKQGARGYFDGSSSVEKLSEALQSVLHGEVWIERYVIAGLIEELAHIPEITEEQRIAVESLSPKELEVAKLVCHGATNKSIAYTMKITERTVKAHLTSIFQKMGLTDRLSLAIFFRDLR